MSQPTKDIVRDVAESAILLLLSRVFTVLGVPIIIYALVFIVSTVINLDKQMVGVQVNIATTQSNYATLATRVTKTEDRLSSVEQTTSNNKVLLETHLRGAAWGKGPN